MALVPAITVVVVAYFGYYAVCGERGYVALQSVETRLADSQGQLNQIDDQNRRLDHRIALLNSSTPDPDLVEELARTQLMDGAPGQVAVPRKRH
ncbi:MAG: septum formation initiator family protein [Alphaproteobacteria bacterium]|nr:septum formation initiator family protein [Alphaproteobacteria bacterium]